MDLCTIPEITACTIPELVSFLKSSHLPSDFRMAEVILICREVLLKKQHSDAMEELKAFCFIKEKNFMEESSRLRSRCDGLKIELETSRKELSELSEAQKAASSEPRKKLWEDQALLRSLLSESEALRTRSARLKKEIKEDEDAFVTAMLNLKSVYENKTSDGMLELRAQCNSLIEELQASVGRCHCLETVNERYRMLLPAAEAEAGRWEEKCMELEARVMEVEERLAAFGSGKGM